MVIDGFSLNEWGHSKCLTEADFEVVCANGAEVSTLDPKGSDVNETPILSVLLVYGTYL